MVTEKQAVSSRNREAERPEDRFVLRQVFPPTDDHGYSDCFAMVGEGLVVSREAALDNRLTVQDQAVSRVHFRLTPKAGALLLNDPGSTNGTFVNGHKVRQCTVHEQDVIRVADTLLLVTCDPPGRRQELHHAGIVAAGEAMLGIAQRIERVADTTRRVLFLGETGTGKDLLASHLHRKSGRHGEMVTVNCATIRESLMESTLFGAREGAFTGAVERTGLVQKAHRGTLFLDEIGEMPQSMQAAMLRFLETGEALPVGEVTPTRADVRLVAATNRVSPEGRVGAQLREDLLARLEDEVFFLPPLREHREDIVPLIFQAIRKAGRPAASVLTPDFVDEALCYPWPRNVRQLLKLVESCVLHLNRREQLSRAHLKERFKELESAFSNGQRRQRRAPRPEHLAKLMGEEGDNIAAVARRLSCHRQQVYRWLKRYRML